MNCDVYEIFGIHFINGNYHEAFNNLKKGQFMVVPSGPGLSTLDQDQKYWEALKGSDFAIPDSGLMIILYKLLYGKSLTKLSGPKFLRQFLKEDCLRKEFNLFLVDPNQKESNINRLFLQSINIPIQEKNQYIAPFYSKENIIDLDLLNYLENIEKRPKFILLNLGGGVQERLGFYLKNNLSFKVGIICTGAAIAFETGQQAKIPSWIDDIYMGWLARVVQNPKLFFMRFLKAFRLVKVFYLDKFNKL